ncbi:restriction endonuclease subunit S [Bifidobacterium adolescentis]|uniref:Type I restriction modification DNA specificity domain protein n=1 Tax=Bifidobacterium adolescentis L2-32 TaxID=411481 RepID=A7A813_BIFAD|nr:restriction endonuclease subunit S [Bifidobacterium adolescentis]EDN81878.1 type I restriction modification DNA specificity domain protein [Bifidobacterium adolescentis L2-32]
MTDKPQFVGKKVTIGELGKTQSGGTPSSKHPEFFNGSIPWIGTTALNGKFLGKNDAVKLITEEAVAKSATKIVPEKSIMVGIRVGVGKVAINAVPMCTSQDIVSIVGIDEASWNKEYISLALQYKAPLLAAQAQGATIAGITSKTLKAIEIPAIPINEQNRVVDILRKLENQVGFVRKQLCGLDALVKSRFVEIFGDFACYETKPLIKCVDCIEAGKSPKCLAFSRKMAEPGVLKLSAISSGVYCENENKALPRSVSLTIDKVVHANDILLSRKNTPELVGRSVLVKHTDGNIMFPDIIFRMHPLPPINAMYLSYLLAGPLLHSIQSLAHGSAKSMSNIPKSELAKLSIPIPALNLQNEFANFVSQVDKSRFVAQQQIEKLQMLYDSLAQEYFGD